ncbi:MAG: hypothetical protein M1827_003486 [Pycnora praestabilis]|nr:MAG: hypothetical protein M1827_003486 [Pycnora praestabilis]
MSEITFAKSFLSTLDNRAIKLPSDHVADQRTFEVRAAYTLPKQSQPMKKRQKLAPGAERSINVSIKSLRNPPLDISLPSQPISTSIQELKVAVAGKAGIEGQVDKIRLLWKKKPVGDMKTLAEVLGDEGEKEVEFSVMIMGGGAAASIPAAGSTSGTGAETPEVESIPAAASAQKGMMDEPMVDAPVAHGPSGEALLKTEEFWDDLKGYLMQRLKDEGEGEKVLGVFRKAWEGHAGS